MLNYSLRINALLFFVAFLAIIPARALEFEFLDNNSGSKITSVSCYIRNIKDHTLTPFNIFKPSSGEYEAVIISAGYNHMLHKFKLTEDNFKTKFIFHLVPKEECDLYSHNQLNSEIGSGFNLFVVSAVDNRTFQSLADVRVFDAYSGKLLGSTAENGYLKIKIPAKPDVETVKLRFEKIGYQTLISTEINLERSYQLKRLRLQIGNGIQEQYELDYSVNHNKAVLEQDNSPWKKYLNYLSGNYPVCDVSTVSVGFSNSSLSPCPTGGCNMANCGHVEVFALDEYVERVLPAEWLLSWQNIPNGAEAFRAGAVAIRTYATWYSINPLMPTYDICSSTCCQVIGSSTYSSTSAAVSATSSVFLWDNENNEEARSEYTSEGNNLETSDSDICDCIPNTCDCGNGFIGRSNTGFPCYPDPVGSGNEGFGHGRGMSQYGTARWASGLALGNACNGSSTSGPSHGLGTKNWQEILNHYYGAYYEIIQCNSSGGCEITINQEFADLDCLDPLINVVVVNSGSTTIQGANVFYSITPQSGGSIIGSGFGTVSGNNFVNIAPGQSFGFQWAVPDNVLSNMCGQYSVAYNIIPTVGCNFFGSFNISAAVNCGCAESVADIAVSEISFTPTVPFAGQSVEICVNYANIGQGDASDVDLSSIAINGTSIGGTDGPNLDAGESTTRCLSYTFNSSGTFQICAVAEEFSADPNLNNNELCVQLQVLPLPCNQPTGLSAANITANSADLTWQPVPEAVTYTLERRVCNSAPWLPIGTIEAPPYTWVSAECGTCYQWRVRTNCTSGSSAFVTSDFTTQTCDCIGIQGCTNPSACNFNPAAQCDNGTCEFITCLGCTLPEACNFNPSATIDDGSCLLPDGCTDLTACNYNDQAQCDDGSCFYPIPITINGFSIVEQGMFTSYLVNPSLPGGNYSWEILPNSFGTIDNSNASAIAISFSELLVGPGSLCVTVEYNTAEGACNTTSCIDLNLVLGIKEEDLQNIRIHPNPVKELLNVEFPKDMGAATFDVYNSIGELVLSRIITDTSQYDLSTFSTGIYYCIIRIDSIFRTFKIQKL